MTRLAATLASLLAVPFATAQSTVSYAEHLERLVRPRPCTGPTVQFASYDRRSRAPGAPHWFANSDGFGGEPVPGFVATLQAPAAGGRGTFLVADVDGPGTLVRTWSAGMGGVLRVYLDGSATPLFSGKAEDFLRRKSEVLLPQAGLDLEVAGSFVQQDADYLPIPFARHLRVTWEGRLDELHFYHLNVARGVPRGGGDLETFSLDTLRRHRHEIERMHWLLRGVGEATADGDEGESFTAELAPGRAFAWDDRGRGEQAGFAHVGSIERLALRCTADDLPAALRGTLLRLRFDGASVPQVEAPLGDFFLSAPGVQPHRSVAMAVHADGWLTCTLPMPFRNACRLELENTTGQRVAVEGRVLVRAAPSVDPGLGHFHAKWRVQHGLVATAGGVDIPYLVALGDGVLVGVACMLVNPTGIPSAGGSWWGEGDEKIWVDGDAAPSTFGTGSEDFYNYSWSRPDLFALPHCGQPTCTGPGTSGYVTNYRWLLADCLPFQRSLAFLLELKHHRRIEGFSYASIAYWYAGPTAIDDHRALVRRDLFVPELPPLGVVADGSARGATIQPASALQPRADNGLRTWRDPLATRHELLGLDAQGGEPITLTLPITEDGRYDIHLVALHRKDVAGLRAALGDRTLAAELDLRRPSACVQDISLGRVDLRAGEHALVLTATGAGVVGLDTVWWKRVSAIPFRAEGVFEAEALPRAAASPGLAVEVQELDGSRWSGGEHLWVKAERDGDFVEFDLPVPEPGRWIVEIQLTRSWDYGIVRAELDGVAAGDPVDTCNHERRAVALAPHVALPARELGERARLRLQVVGSADGSAAPGRYFGLDWVRLRRAE